MNKILGNTFIFAAGAALGSVVTWYIVKTKYEQIAQEEIESVKKAFLGKDDFVDNEGKIWSNVSKDEATDVFTEEDKEEYGTLLEDLNYSNPEPVQEEGDTTNMVEKPIVIRPDEFGEYGYETVSLTYHADGVVADDYGEVLDDDRVDLYVGLDALKHFGEYEDDSVFVRNHERRTDYEILKDLTNFYADGDEEESEDE